VLQAACYVHYMFHAALLAASSVTGCMLCALIMFHAALLAASSVTGCMLCALIIICFTLFVYYGMKCICRGDDDEDDVTLQSGQVFKSYQRKLLHLNHVQTED
jgi:hypothetical protein